jgi:4-alpha-glucanotransferase
VPALRSEFDAFRAAHARWLDDYSLFRAIKDAHGGTSWLEWNEDLVRRDPASLQRARTRLADAIDAQRFHQFLFFRQWLELRQHARAKRIRIMGDAPIFVAVDSSDVWTAPQYFKLDAVRRPRVVAGVPPDYFSATGQLWGNPLYDWDAMARDRFVWWTDRLRAMLELVDLVRIDHFRGFVASWEVEAGMPTAEVGEWVPGPGAALFEALRSGLGSLPILVEDLGVITPEVHALRDRLGLPGIRVLQFAFGGDPDDRFLPHRYARNTVVYTGTHDNDTTRGWYVTLPERERAVLHRYLGRRNPDIPWELVRLASSSVADTAIVPLQDVLELGSEARMNLPGSDTGNWTWRFTRDQIGERVVERLGELAETYGRAPRDAAPDNVVPPDTAPPELARRSAAPVDL